MSGIILAFAIQYGLIVNGLPPISAEMDGGFHVGPIYALVAIRTDAEQLMALFDYVPLRVNYDFRIGVRFEGFDLSITRFCSHGIFESHDGDSGWLAIRASWSTWP